MTQEQTNTINQAIDDALSAPPNGDDRELAGWIRNDWWRAFSEPVCQAILQGDLEATIRERAKERGIEVKENQVEYLYFGGCPQCGGADGYRNIGPCGWFYCKEHRTCWNPGFDLSGDCRYQTVEDWLESARALRNYALVEPVYKWPASEPQPAPKPQRQMTDEEWLELERKLESRLRGYSLNFHEQHLSDDF